MHILILGNGFDLAHQLPTRYNDFLNYCREKYNGKQTTENVWIKHFLNKTLDGENWIDFEKEIYNVISNISSLNYFNNKVTSERYKRHAFFLSKSRDLNFDEYRDYFKEPESLPNRPHYHVPIKDFVDFLYTQLREFIKEFETYLKEVVETKIATKNFIIPQSKQVPLRVLSFNYTNTFERLYEPERASVIDKPQYIYVHGDINSYSNNELILGTQSFSNENISVEFNVFKKHNQRHRYGSIEAYQKLLKEIKWLPESDPPIFHVIGHSLDEADHNILRHLFNANDNAEINIYYHNEDAQKRMMNNIDLIIGEENVMAKVKFIAQDDPQRGILIPKVKEHVAEVSA